MDAKYKTSFRLTFDAVKNLNALADEWQCSKTQVIERLLREACPVEPSWLDQWLSLFGPVRDFRVFLESREVFVNGNKVENVPDEFWDRIGEVEGRLPNRLITNLSGLNWPGCRVES